MNFVGRFIFPLFVHKGLLIKRGLFLDPEKVFIAVFINNSLGNSCYHSAIFFMGMAAIIETALAAVRNDFLKSFLQAGINSEIAQFPHSGSVDEYRP